MCVESCPATTNWDALWACTDDDLAYTTQEEYDCASNPSECLSRADLVATGDGGTFSGGGEGTCMYQIESVECECVTPH